jgi:putative endonuclease
MKFTIFDLLAFSQSARHIRVGKSGERIARIFLRRKGYRILGRNVRIGKDEVDIVAFDPSDRVVVFAEVKTRYHAGEDYHPEMSITTTKKRKMARAARRWMSSRGCALGYRIDVLCVEGRRVTQHYVDIDLERDGSA